MWGTLPDEILALSFRRLDLDPFDCFPGPYLNNWHIFYSIQVMAKGILLLRSIIQILSVPTIEKRYKSSYY